MSKGRHHPGAMSGGGGMLKQAQKMQQQMEKVQEELAQELVEHAVGGGAVKAVVDGSLRVREVQILPDAVNPEDVEMLQDLVLAAVNGALEKAQELASEKMGQITGGLNIPGLF